MRKLEDLLLILLYRTQGLVDRQIGRILHKRWAPTKDCDPYCSICGYRCSSCGRP